MEQLKENTDYTFRVSAINKMGQSAPKQTSGMLRTKKKQRKPQVSNGHLIVIAWLLLFLLMIFNLVQSMMYSRDIIGSM